MQNQNDKSLQIYYKQADMYPLLTPSQEVECFKQLKTAIDSKDQVEIQRLREHIINSNLKLVLYCAHKVNKSLLAIHDTDMKMLDLIQVGNMTLMKAVDVFDYTLKNRFSTYAMKSIYTSLYKKIYTSRFIHIPSNHHKYLKQIRKLINDSDKVYTDEEICKKLKIKSTFFKLLKHDIEDHGIDTSVDMDFLLANTDIPDENSYHKNQFHNIDQIDLNQLLIEKIDKLKPKQKKLAMDRYFKKSTTLHQIATKYGISRQAVSSSLNVALKNIKQMMYEDGITNTSLFFK